MRPVPIAICMAMVILALLGPPKAVRGIARNYNAPKVEVIKNPALQHTQHVALVTAYTAYAESTGKNPGDKGFNITKSGYEGGFGVCAADLRYWGYGTVILIKGLGACVILDSGGAIKGKWRFDYMFGGRRQTAYALAMGWGKRNVMVTVLERKR